MDTKKLDRWAELLLDTGKRNNLINFKDTRLATVEVLLPTPSDLFAKVGSATPFEIIAPGVDKDEANAPERDPKERSEKSKEDRAQARREAYLTRHAKKIKRNNQILPYNTLANPLAAVKNLAAKAREFIEETGVNVAYMAFGFVHWYERDAPLVDLRAPLLLVPIQLERASTVSSFLLRSTDDDIIVNPTFSYLLDAEYGFKLPEYEDEGFDAYLEKVGNLIAPLQWTVSAECKIGIFSFLKINMYRDLKDNEGAILANQTIRKLLGEPANAEEPEPKNGESLSIENPLIELHSVVDADSSQIEAIMMAKSGKSFVLQGPPGTGKSQTITNIIAECLSDGKKVLFVSEKMAALNVVYEKLRRAGLTEFCLQLHSHKANKKDVIAEIYRTLRTKKRVVSAKASTEVSIKKEVQRRLDLYVSELHRQHPVIEKSVYQLFEAYSALRSMPDVRGPLPALSSNGSVYLAEVTSLLEQYVDYIPSIGYDYRKNPWYGYIHQDQSYQSKAGVESDLATVIKLLEVLLPIQQELAEKCAIPCTNLKDAHIWNMILSFIVASKLITPALLDKTRFDAVASVLQELKVQSEPLLALRTSLNAEFDEDIYKLDGATCHKKLTKQFGGFFSRLFNSEYKQLIADLYLPQKAGRKPSYKKALAITEQLANFQQKNATFVDTESPIKPFLGEAYRGLDTDWDSVTGQLSAMEKIFTNDVVFAALKHVNDQSIEEKPFAELQRKLKAALEHYDADAFKRAGEYFDRTILDIYSMPCSVVLPRLKSCITAFDALDNWCHFRKLLNQLEEKQVLSYLNTVIDESIDETLFVGTFQKQFYHQWIDLLLSESQTLSTIDRVAHEKTIHTFVEKDKEQFEINKATIRSELSLQRPSLDVIVPGSMLATLLREGEKKRNQKSIRALFAETGELVQQIKPCFLMSPLSVSTFLTPDAIHFDVVIFDEASQVFPQDAIGAIYRADQLIVVGDSQQMPPSNFFTATLEAENKDEETGDVADFESILDLCAASMQQLRLRWHYRSRFEQLISFSNKNFYDNDLVTFPSPSVDTAGIGVDYYYVAGLFNRKTHTNRKEAEFIVDLIYQHIEKYPDRSLGVVAFSVSQQSLIDSLLSARREREPSKEFFFTSSKDEPFFIKNLETVQGDERDTIIFSVAYGFDESGHLLHNFGPLNRVGGERRLNVAITRAKCNVQLVSSMRHTDIDLTRTSAKGASLLRDYLDYAENGTHAVQQNDSARPFEQSDADFELEVCEYLRSEGFTVDNQIGRSGARIDLGVRSPDGSNYVLAIECDGATYQSAKNTRDRDRLRQEVLERMGWRFYRVWATDWFKNRQIEQHRLLEVANEAIHATKSAKIVEKVKIPQSEIFEEDAIKDPFDFPVYKVADVRKLAAAYLPRDFKGMIRAILEIEAPLAEELLIERIAWCFGRKSVTDVVRRSYEKQMEGSERYAIVRKNGFVYLDNGKEILFRKPGDITRTIAQIAPEELAAGMLKILEQNVTADQNGLYRSLASQCGVADLNKSATVAMDKAMSMLKDHIVVNEGKGQN